MTDLNAFLLARIGEEEGWARGADRRDSERPIDRLTGAEIFEARGLMFPVARVLAECEAKRRIVQSWADPFGHWCAAEADAAARQKRQVLQLLALPYADHPDYREEWRP